MKVPALNHYMVLRDKLEKSGDLGILWQTLGYLPSWLDFTQ